ncbi:hypothetical protein ALUC_10361S [Aspergillus luchuensis]|nr:hypothetical protein ALUC_10361S [Aspergillus luchuensis]
MKPKLSDRLAPAQHGRSATPVRKDELVQAGFRAASQLVHNHETHDASQTDTHWISSGRKRSTNIKATSTWPPEDNVSDSRPPTALHVCPWSPPQGGLQPQTHTYIHTLGIGTMSMLMIRGVGE